ncbi:MAG TPA: DUF1257 domain-containing protein [Pirellulales bacterium]|nr:DUF1257 domain-containing protein [Pirellulales bacterium]
MSTVIVITPILIASWPAIAAAVTAAVGTLGFAIARNRELEAESELSESSRAEIEVENSEILADATGGGEELVVEREGIVARFSRDGRGALKVCMEGKGYSKAELRRVGEELVGRVTQQYVYHRVVTELKQRNMAIVDEQVEEDRTVKIRVRNW